MRLERYEQNGLELLINLENGEVFGSQSALVRMLEDIPVAESTLRYFASSQGLGLKKVQAPTNKGLRMVRVYTEDDMYEVFDNFNSPLLKQCAKCGLRVYLHQLAGFKVTSTAVQSKDSYFEVKFLEMETRLTNSMVNTLAPLVEKITKFEQSCQDHKGAGQVIQATTEEKTYPTELLTCHEYCAKKGLDRKLWNTFSRRYGRFVSAGKGIPTPPRKRGRLAITGIFFEYADVVLQNVMEFA